MKWEDYLIIIGSVDVNNGEGERICIDLSAVAIFALIIFDQSRPFAVTPRAVWSSCRGRCKPTPTCVWKSSGVCLVWAFVIQLALKRSNCLWAKLSLLPIYLTGSAESFNECCQATVETGRWRHWPKRLSEVFFSPSQLDIHVPSACAHNAHALYVRKRFLFAETKWLFFFFNRSSKIQKTFNTTTWMIISDSDKWSVCLSARRIFHKGKFSSSFTWFCIFATDISSHIQLGFKQVFVLEKRNAEAHEPNMTQISADTKCSAGALHLRKPNNAIWLHDYPECRLQVPSFTLIVWHERTEREGWELSEIHFLDWFRFRDAIKHIISEVGLARCISQADCLLYRSPAGNIWRRAES